MKILIKILSEVYESVRFGIFFKKGRFLLKNRGNVLSKEQQLIIKQIQNKTKQKIYKKESNVCICGSNSDSLIAIRDRYGIDVHTVICKHGGLIRTNPYYTQETLNDFYNEEYRKLYVLGERNDDLFFLNQANKGLHYLKNIQEALNCVFEYKNVYEIGCGMGGILKPFKDNNCKIKGVDLGEEYINIGKNKFDLDLITGDYNALKNCEQADLIILSHILEHIKNPVEFLKNIRDIIIEDGLIYIAVPTIETIPIVYSSNLFHYLQNAHIYNFSIETLRYIIELAGYEIVKTFEKEGTVIARKSNNYRTLSDVPRNEYYKSMALLSHYEKQYNKKNRINLFQKFFSVKNEYSSYKKHKVVTVLGIKIKLRIKNINSNKVG